jgi:hypothetical protein
MERLRAVARERLEPALMVAVGRVELEGRTIVWCSVPISPARPHAAVGNGGALEIVARVGASNRRASGATLRAIQAQRASGASPDPLQRRVLAWVGERASPATVARFARAHNVGLQRARRAFTQLELSGRLVGHGAGSRRLYSIP